MNYQMIAALACITGAISGTNAYDWLDAWADLTLEEVDMACSLMIENGVPGYWI